MCLLKEEIEREQKEQLFRDYVGQTLWIINTIQHLKTTKENDMPQYVEIAHPELKKKDDGLKTTEEIIQYVLDGLG